MPRKKQNKEAPVESTVKYTGQVTIEKVRANKVLNKTVIKNTGCLPLFKFLAECLTIATAENVKALKLFDLKPQYLNCFYKSAAEIGNSGIDFETQQVKSYMKQFNVSVSSNEDVATTPSAQVNAYYQIDIKFLLQDNNFKNFSSAQESDKINILALYGNSNIDIKDSPHAYIIIDNPANYLYYQEGVNYIITWTLKLANK